MTFLRACLAAATLLTAFGPARAHAQLMGNDGWNYSSANRTFYAQGQLLQRQQQAASATTAGSSGSGALTQYVYTSNTVGNIDQISQTLTGGSTAYLSTNTGQATTGNQAATSQGSPSSGATINVTPSGNSSAGH